MHKGPARAGLFCSFKPMKAAPFSKAERLKSRKQIEHLFAAGRGIVQHPVRVKYSVVPRAADAPPVQVGVSVPRKTFKRAVDRNRLKRQLREAYRLQKAGLLQAVAPANRQVVLFLIYTGKRLLPFEVIYNAVAYCLAGLQQNVLAHYENRS